ncbi:LOW QUALITY PROTEIN: retinol dehydrogenase 12-like [Dermacentor silvarum]|uniref:LOW QUALITY PROTEIN: retinol dehydrogenase 12-like n=1 Tax=Dermacentor silvarum TaxID=543639 RepID=UPI00189A534F|nr:LOW QUALITY PROTEIN: retinol dehydrogenase 12-like [Dermacentor silvarum]
MLPHMLWISLCLALLAVLLLTLVRILNSRTVGQCTSTRDMSGKTVIITGASSGIGKATARELCRRNARVILACRDEAKARATADEIEDDTGVRPACMQLDLCSLASVRQFAHQVLAQEERLDVLINNAGTLPPPERTETEDGFEMTFQANHLGHFLLTNLLIDLLKKSAPSRIINVGSMAQVFGRFEVDNIGFKRYKQNRIYSSTKLYNMLFTVELARRLAGTGVTANCCHPGIVKTHLADRGGADFHSRLLQFIVVNFGKSVEEGAQTSVHLAVSEESVSGKMFSDCKQSWAPRWATNPEHARMLWEASETMTGIF